MSWATKSICDRPVSRKDLGLSGGKLFLLSTQNHGLHQTYNFVTRHKHRDFLGSLASVRQKKFAIVLMNLVQGLLHGINFNFYVIEVKV